MWYFGEAGTIHVNTAQKDAKLDSWSAILEGQPSLKKKF